MSPLAVALLVAAPAAPPSFTNEVVPLFTKAGCNSGGCHGKGAGQNGFRLSLRGYAPDQDHRWLTREFDGRRVDRTTPADSLLVRKATAQTPHEGGRLFAVNSPEHRLLVDWIAAGAPGPNTADPKVTALELRPASAVLKRGESVRLSAVATFADGSTRDVTALTKFDTNDPAQVGVSPAGTATAARHGTGAVRAMYQTEVAVAVFATPFPREVDAKRYAERVNVVDDHLFAKLKELHVEPSDACSDAEFVRRVMLDAAGVLPTTAEATAFVADRDPKKREKLVDAVLARPEFTDYWTLQLGDLLQNRRERDHDVRGVKGVRQFHDWLRAQVAANRPWDALARDVLTATGSAVDSPAVGYFVVTVGEHKQTEKSEVAESVAQAFLGARIGCARCHNHPLERYTQDDFYHFAAFFSRVKLSRKDPKKGPEPTTLVMAHPDDKQNTKPVGVTQPRTGAFMAPQSLDRAPAAVVPGSDPRVPLAKWVTDPANAAFAGAMANRVWRHYMGVGLVEPVDDLRATNPPSNPALWKALSAEFVAGGYDLRKLMRLVLTSRAYGLSASTRAGNEVDARFHSHYYARRLPAEVLLDAIGSATGVPEKFDGYPVGVRAVQVPDPGAASYFLKAFGRSDRTTACACERAGDVNLPQVLHLIGGDAVAGKLSDGTGWLAKTLATEKNDDAVLDVLWGRTLSRPPTAAERSAVKGLLATDGRADVFRDAFWAVLNSKEFLFNR